MRIEHNLHPAKKKEAIKKMIIEKRLVAAPGCRLLPPVIQDNMMIIRAEDERNDNSIKSQADLLAAIDRIQVRSAPVTATAQVEAPKLESLLKNMTGAAATETETAAQPAKQPGSQMAGYIVFFGTVLLALRRSKLVPEEKTK